jgi:hypothetical protein
MGRIGHATLWVQVESVVLCGLDAMGSLEDGLVLLWAMEKVGKRSTSHNGHGRQSDTRRPITPPGPMPSGLYPRNPPRVPRKPR